MVEANKLGKYCKAFPVRQLRAYKQWNENEENVRSMSKEGQQEDSHTLLADSDILYLHDNYFVTDGIQKDENIIFSDVTEAWIRYCQEVLAFQIPNHE